MLIEVSGLGVAYRGGSVETPTVGYSGKPMGSFHSQSGPFRTPKLFAGTFISLMIVLMMPQLACAQNANTAPPTASQVDNAQEHPYNGDDATRPLNLIQLCYTYKTAPGTTRSVA
jgi:hypothetical protein